MAQLSLLSNQPASLPPFRSAKDFPVSPKPEKARALYPECLQALVDSNEARRLLRESMDAKKTMMERIRNEIAKLENDLALEPDARIRLHEMSEALVNALAEIDGFTGEVISVVTEAHRTPRTQLGGIIEKLRALPRRWQAFRAAHRQTIANALNPSEDRDHHE
jgi:hypothetical protein